MNEDIAPAHFAQQDTACHVIQEADKVLRNNAEASKLETQQEMA